MKDTVDHATQAPGAWVVNNLAFDTATLSDAGMNSKSKSRRHADNDDGGGGGLPVLGGATIDRAGAGLANQATVFAECTSPLVRYAHTTIVIVGQSLKPSFKIHSATHRFALSKLSSGHSGREIFS